MGLTVKRVDKLIHAGERGRHFDDAGLYLVIGGKKSANWTRRYELDHRAHWMGLGSAKTFTLDEARDRNRESQSFWQTKSTRCMKRQTERAERAVAQMKARSFEECAREYIAQHQGE